DEIDMFLEPERITASTVNAITGHTLFGVRWQIVLLIIFVVSAFCVVAVKKQQLAIALVWGFAISWACMDARSIYDDATIVLKGHRPTGVEMFSDRAAEII